MVVSISRAVGYKHDSCDGSALNLRFNLLQRLRVGGALSKWLFRAIPNVHLTQLGLHFSFCGDPVGLKNSLLLLSLL